MIRNVLPGAAERSIVVIVHDVRSAHNVGSIFRTADGAGASGVYLTGYTPAPPTGKEPYLTRAQKDLAKTALGAEASVPWEKRVRLAPVLSRLRREGFEIVALEQDQGSVDYRLYEPSQKVALLVGNEVAGMGRSVLGRCDRIVEIPMRGKKNSLNVSVAFGIAVFEIKSKMEWRAGAAPG
jgi:23S rRNA (guanosine2251-2'-O)-methyltransferase